MNREQAYILLKKSIKTISDIPDKLVDDLFDICKLIHIKKGQFFQLEGDIPQYMGFVLNGIFRYYYINNNGNELTKGFSVTGQFVVSYSALVENRLSYFFIEATADTDILRFNYNEFMKLVNANIRWYPFLFKTLETLYIMKEMREKSFLLDDATTRYLDFKKIHHNLEGKIKLFHIASYLGITPEALSRIRKKIKNEKLI